MEPNDTTPKPPPLPDGVKPKHEIDSLRDEVRALRERCDVLTGRNVELTALAERQQDMVDKAFKMADDAEAQAAAKATTTTTTARDAGGRFEASIEPERQNPANNPISWDRLQVAAFVRKHGAERFTELLAERNPGAWGASRRLEPHHG
jgi:hypothetical protein